MVSFDPERLLEERLEQLHERAPETWQLLQQEPVLLRQAKQVLLGSEFALQSLIQDPAALQDLWSGGRMAASCTTAEYAAQSARLLASAPATEADASRVLRQW